jgi:hypothetical protein
MTDKGARPDPGIRPWNAELMEETRKMNLAELQQRIGCGEYEVDARAVAEAIVQRLQPSEPIGSERHRPAQSECS